MNQYQVIVRLFLAAPDPRAAADLWGARLGGPVRRHTLEPYWKEPDWQIATWELIGNYPSAEAALDAVEAVVGPGWQRGGGDGTLFSTWSPGSAPDAEQQGLRFANLEVLKEKPRRGRFPSPVS